MEIILMERVAKLGSVGMLLQLKTDMLVIFSYLKERQKSFKESIEEFKKIKDEIEKKEKELYLMQQNNQSFSKFIFKISKKASVDGKFLVQSQIRYCEFIEENNVKISKSMISLPDGPIKRTGEHNIVITLHPDVVVNVNLNIIGEV